MLRFDVPFNSTTSSFFSAGKKASPLGFTRSVITAAIFPLPAIRSTLIVACSGFAQSAGQPLATS